MRLDGLFRRGLVVTFLCRDRGDEVQPLLCVQLERQQTVSKKCENPQKSREGTGENESVLGTNNLFVYVAQDSEIADSTCSCHVPR